VRYGLLPQSFRNARPSGDRSQARKSSNRIPASSRSFATRARAASSPAIACNSPSLLAGMDCHHVASSSSKDALSSRLPGTAGGLRRGALLLAWLLKNHLSYCTPRGRGNRARCGDGLYSPSTAAGRTIFTRTTNRISPAGRRPSLAGTAAMPACTIVSVPAREPTSGKSRPDRAHSTLCV